MYCHVCGKHNPDHATSCHACGAAFGNPYQTPTAYGVAPPARLNNYLAPAIFATLCCCLPFGIVAIVYAAQVNARLSGGDVQGAQLAAQNAKMWFWIAFGVGIVPQILYFGFVIVAGLAGALDGPPR